MDGLILVAAGSSQRFGGRTSKVLRLLAGTPVLVRALTPFRIAVDRLGVVVVARPDDHAQIRKWIPRARIVEGGATRAESVRRGLEAVGRSVEVVLVHDAARPLVSAGLVRRVLEAAHRDGAAAPVVRVVDSIHRVERGGEGAPWRLAETLDRSRLFAAQTPQGARVDLLRRAYEAAGEAAREATDEVGLLVGAGIPVTAVLGEETNRKVTTPEDLAFLEMLLRED